MGGACPLKIIKIIADKIKPFLAKELLLINWGEPLLNKDIFSIIKYASKINSHTIISTNGNMVDKELALRLIEADPEQLLFQLMGSLNIHMKNTELAEVLKKHYKL
ncbi:hypothetical protein FACS189491_11870 [Spirochaetia bacterium]|nr:hypothetical protein FACS189491_11870 [Spirochaetia bacterium]